RFAGAVGADDRVRLAFLDLKVDVGQGAQAAEVLLDVGDVENDIFPGLHFHVAFSYSAGWARASRARFEPFPIRPNQAAVRRAPSMIPPGRNTTISTKTRPSDRCQPSPTNFELMVTATSRTPSGRKLKKPLSTLALNEEKMFSKYLMIHAPSTGPTRVPTPPRMVISTTSPEAVQRMRSAPASGSVTTSSAPA